MSKYTLVVTEYFNVNSLDELNNLINRKSPLFGFSDRHSKITDEYINEIGADKEERAVKVRAEARGFNSACFAIKRNEGDK